MAVKRIGIRIASVLAFAFLLSISGAAAAAEVIKSFHSDIALDKTDELTVTETIVVNVENDKINHGIYRDLPFPPLAKRDAEGFEVVSVELDGHSEDFSVEEMDNGTRIYVGSADRIVPVGVHEYRLKYKTIGTVDYNVGNNLLSWHVTGTWEFPMEKVSAEIRLPEGASVQGTVINTSGFTGGKIYKNDDGVVIVGAEGGLPKGASISISVSISQDYY